jgi:hypothetical protein
MVRLRQGVSCERVGDSWLVLCDRGGVVHNLTGPAATVIDCVTNGQPVPPDCADAEQALLDAGVLVATTGWSRRKVLAAGGTAAAVGLVTLTLPTAAMAASPGPFGTITASAGDGEVTLAWAAVEGTTYQVYFKLFSDTTYTTVGVPVSEGPVTKTGLTNGLAYDFYIESIVGGEVAATSAVVTATPIPDPNRGVTWTAATAAEQNPWKSVAYGNGVWVAVAESGTNRVMRSTDDGVTWTAVNVQANLWQSVAYGNGLWIAVASSGGNRVMRSATAGLTWLPLAATQANLWQSVAYGNGVWVAVASNGTDQVMYSTNGGINWTTAAAPEANSWKAVAYGNGVWVAVAEFGTNRVMRSTDDGVTWAAVAAPEENSWKSVAYGNGVWIAVASNGTNRVMRSTDDGLTWTAAAATEANLWQSVAYGNGVWVAVADDGTNQVMRSTNDGVTWTAVAAAEASLWRSVASGNKRFVAVANSGANRVMYSPSPAPTP